MADATYMKDIKVNEMTNSGEGWYLSEEEWLLKQNVRELVEKEIAPRFKENKSEETADKFYKEAMKKLGEAGFLRAWGPEKLGCYGMRPTVLGIIAEEVARGNGAIAIHALENPLVGIRMASASPAAWEKHGEDILNGAFILAGATCAPEGQVNYAEQADIATFDEETQEWVLNGEKAFCSGGTFCDYLRIAGLYKGELYQWSMYPNHPGLTIHHNPEVGCSPTSASVTMKNVRIPKEFGGPTGQVKDRVALPGSAMSCLFHTCVGCMAIGSAEAALDKTIEYLKHRTSNFKPIASLGQIQYKLVDMKAKLEAARCLTYTALHMIETNYKDAVLYSHLAKTFTCDTARWITAECVQMHGNVGANPDSGVAQHMMDAVVYGIGTGTSDMHINSAAHEMGLPESDNKIYY